MARKKEFEGRMLAILDPAIRRASPGRLQAAAVIGTLGLVSLTVAAVSPAAATPLPPHQTYAAPKIAEVPTASSSDAPAAPTSFVRSSTPLPTPAPAPAATPAPAVSRSVRGLSVHVKTGNPLLDDLVNDVANVVVSSVGTAFQQAGAELARSGRLQATDTGRVAMMIKILATDTDASVRRTAAWGLHDLETRDVREALMKALRSDADEHVREMSAWALGEHENDVAAPALGDALMKDKSPRVRSTAAWALGETEAKSELAALETAMSDSSAQIREVSAWALGRIEDKGSSKALVRGLTDPSKSVRLSTAWALGQIEDRSVAPAILTAFKGETDSDIRSAELRTLAVLGEITPELVEDALKSSDPAVRRRAVGLLAGSGSVEPWPWPRPQPRPSP
jgi:HEAT repeat protein